MTGVQTCALPISYVINDKKFKVFIGQEEINSIVTDLARRINEDYEGKEILFIVVLKGAIFFAVDLLREINLKCELQVVQAKSYGMAMSSSGSVKLDIPEMNLIGKNVIVVEDILDTGYTLKALIENLQSLNPESLEITVLLSKPEMRKVDIDVKYLGKEIPSVFVVGSGLDYAEQGRNLKGIYALSE